MAVQDLIVVAFVVCVTQAAVTSSKNGVCSDGTCEDIKDKWTMPLVKLGDRMYYFGLFQKANWFKAGQFCRYHGLHLVSLETSEENQRLEEYLRQQGLLAEHFWTAGTDQGEEGKFFWVGTGRQIGFANWNAGEPNNFKYENGEEEHCLELWDRDTKGLKWNDSPCSFETYFICEKQDY